MPSLFRTYSNLYKPLVISLTEYFFTIIFLTYLIYPLYVLYRKTEIGYRDILLSSPIKPGEIFIGELLALLPFYFIGILIIGPLFIGLIMQIMVLNIFHIIIIYFSIFGVSFLGLLVGTTIANWIEYKISNKGKSNNFDKVALLVISLLVIVVFYSFHFIFEYISRHPEFKNLLIFYPSFWYSNLILYIIDPSLQDLYILDFWSSLGLSILIPILFLFISYKLANKHYILVESNKKQRNSFLKEHIFYKLIKILTPLTIRFLIITQFKNFFRKRENIVKIFYVLGLTVAMGIIISLSLKDISFELGIEFKYVKEVVILILSWMGGMIFGILISTNIFLDSKEIFYLYKKTPRGIYSFVFTYIYQMSIIIILLDLILTIFMAILFNLNLFFICLFFLFFLLNCLSFLLQAIGIQCYNPLFDERAKDIFLMVYLIIFIQIVSLVISLYIVIPRISYSRDPTRGLLNILFINLEITIVISILILSLGILRLKKREF